jgi:hypothetical protein
LKEFWKIFFWPRDCGVLLRVLGNHAGSRGVLVVNLWWICGGTWCFVTAFLGTENLPRITDLFLGIPVLGIGLIQGGIVRLSGSE